MATYHVSIEERVYTSYDESLLVGIADVAVTHRASVEPRITAVTTPKPVKVPMPEEVTERFLEVRLTQTGEVVCVIELLSPKNKRTGKGRVAYERKRQKILASQTSLVAVDLLRGGKPMPVIGEADGVYRVLVSRGYQRSEAELYAFGLKDALPAIRIPLRPGEAEPEINLQVILDDVYDRARFDLVIDYAQPLRPALSAEGMTWMKALGVENSGN
ncbi:MAG: DUF4058 family protein [Leptolyngbya sp. SIO4C1]|nr:DUF4058 family protein [Leptolyngbya sp. SIO4C1]